MIAQNLDTRALVRFGGDDAEKLLNDTLTGRIDSQMGGEGRWFALLSPQGKVLVEGLVTYADGFFWADIEAGVAADLIKRMSMYRLRAKVTIENVGSQFTTIWSPTDGLPGLVFKDIRAPGLGYRSIIDWADLTNLGDEITATGGGATAYDAARIGAGIAELGPDFGASEVFAHDIGMDILDGIDFVKGCYVGQEVVSRMKHRGTARRRPVIVSGIDAPAGTAVVAGAREAGTIGKVVDGQAVAILRLDRITDLGAVSVDGKPVQLSLPVWATYQFGEASPDIEESSAQL